MDSKVDFFSGQKYGNSDEILDSVAKFRWYFLDFQIFIVQGVPFENLQK